MTLSWSGCGLVCGNDPKIFRRALLDGSCTCGRIHCSLICTPDRHLLQIVTICELPSVEREGGLLATIVFLGLYDTYSFDLIADPCLKLKHGSSGLKESGKPCLVITAAQICQYHIVAAFKTLIERAEKRYMKASR